MLDFFLWNVSGDSSEYLKMDIIQDSDTIGQIILETDRSELQFAVSYQFSRALDFKPLNIAGKTFAAIRSGRKKDHPANLAPAAHDLSLFQKIDKVIDFGDRREANRPEFFKAVVYFFLFTHLLTSPKS
jgi:hypothetical protein